MSDAKDPADADNTAPPSNELYGTALLEAADQTREADQAAKDVDQELEPFFVFTIGNTQLAIPAATIETITAPTAPVRLPHAPAHVRGLVPFGDSTLAIVDLHRFLELPESTEETTPRLMVVHHSGCTIGMLCDSVVGVRPTHASGLGPAQLVRGGRLAEFVHQELLGESMPIGVLDLESLLHAARVRAR